MGRMGIVEMAHLPGPAAVLSARASETHVSSGGDRAMDLVVIAIVIVFFALSTAAVRLLDKL